MTSTAPVPRVLIADADEATRTQVRVALGRGSYEVVEARETAEAIEHIAAVLPDLVVLDVGLPGAGGLRLTRSLKAQPETRGAVVLLLFHRTAPVDRVAGREAGVDDFLAKPFTSLGLVTKVDGLLRGDGPA